MFYHHGMFWILQLMKNFKYIWIPQKCFEANILLTTLTNQSFWTVVSRYTINVIPITAHHNQSRKCCVITPSRLSLMSVFTHSIRLLTLRICAITPEANWYASTSCIGRLGRTRLWHCIFCFRFTQTWRGCSLPLSTLPFGALFLEFILFFPLCFLALPPPFLLLLFFFLLSSFIIQMFSFLSCSSSPFFPFLSKFNKIYPQSVPLPLISYILLNFWVTYCQNICKVSWNKLGIHQKVNHWSGSSTNNGGVNSFAVDAPLPCWISLSGTA